MYTKSKNGYFGNENKFGGSFVPEILMSAIKELQIAYKNIFSKKSFQKELRSYYKGFIGRPTPLIYAKNASKILENHIYLKFEGLANTGAHKINNALAQVLLAKKMNKKKVIAETGAGQHGVAVASVCAFLNMPCTIFMGEIDANRQRPNVFLMKNYGANVEVVKSGSKTLKDAVNEALKEWSKDCEGVFYVLGSALGPNPYPDMVRDAQSIIGEEIKSQCKDSFNGLPNYVIACVGGGSNAMGAFNAFLKNKKVKLIGVEGGGNEIAHAARLAPIKHNGNVCIKEGIAHGYKSIFIQDKNGQLGETHSISAGLDYAGISPQLAHLHDVKRVKFMYAIDKEALEAMSFFAKNEGILAALESSHALAGAIKISQKVKNKNIVVNVSGRGDKDIFITAKHLDLENWYQFLKSEIQDIEKLMQVNKIENNKNYDLNLIEEPQKIVLNKDSLQ